MRDPSSQGAPVGVALLSCLILAMALRDAPELVVGQFEARAVPRPAPRCHAHIKALILSALESYSPHRTGLNNDHREKREDRCTS
jgi:hypothetical protein